MTPEERAWVIVRRAYEERTPVPHRSGGRRTLIAAAVVAAAVVAAVVSPPGHAVFERVRTAVGVSRPATAPFALPAPGRLLVKSAEGGGTWVIAANGKQRRIGSWTYASWSPHGLYVVAADATHLVALEPDGRVRWSMARRGVAWPTWEGTLTDTRIAYFDADGLRVVAGDGTGDHLLDPYAAAGIIAWDPARPHTLTYLDGDEIVDRTVDTGTLVWQHKISLAPSALAWSSDGKRLAIVSGHRVLVLDGAGREVTSIPTSGEELIVAAFGPHSHQLALSLRRDVPTRRSLVALVDVDRPGSPHTVFQGPGAFGDLAWSPAGSWLLVDWRAANEWLFVKPGAHPRVIAVGHIAQQFPRKDGLGPELQLAGGWCCPAG